MNERDNSLGWRIFDALCEKPYGLTIHQLIDAAYGHRADGGPDTANSSISVTLCNFNKARAKQNSGVRIHSFARGMGARRTRGGPGSVYRIWIVKEPTNVKN